MNEEQRAYFREYARKWRALHPGRTEESNRRWREKNPDYWKNCREARRRSKRARDQQYRRWLREVTSGMLCISCGAVDRLIFHHRDPTTKAFAIGAGSHPIPKALDEMQKCDVLCRPCHNRLHNRLRREAK